MRRAPWLLLLAATAVRADTFGVSWTALEHPTLAGYRVHVREVGGAYTQDLDLPATETEVSIGGLVGACRTYCVSVVARDESGALGPVASEVCGHPDPEVLDVAWSGGKWQLLGDNLATDATVYLDDDAGPTPSTRLGCQTLVLSDWPILDLRVRNVADGAGVRWELPALGYLKPASAFAVVVLECALSIQSGKATVTNASYTPGIALGVDADLPGVGSDCAGAVAAALALPGMNTSKLKMFSSPKGTTYLFVK